MFSIRATLAAAACAAVFAMAPDAGAQTLIPDQNLDV